CKALHFWAGIFILIAMARLIARISPAGSRLLGPAFYFTMPVVVVSLGWAWNDAFFVFFMLLCLSYLLDYHLSDKTGDGTGKARTPRFLLTAGIAAGLAAWTKYMFVMVFLALILLFLAALVRWRWKWHHLLWFLVPTALISLLVFAKNWAFTGNPFYPFLHGIFPSPYWNDAAAAFFDKTLRNYELPGWNWSTYLLFPIHLTIKARLIDIHPGVLPLALTPLLFFRGAGRGVFFLKIFLLSNMVMWLLLRTVTRSLLLMFAVLFCVAAVELERRVWTRKAFRRPLVIFLTVALVLSLGITLVSNYYLSKPIPYFFGLESGGKFLEREARSQVVYQWLNNNSNVRNVLLVGLHGPYYLQRFAYYSSIVDPPVAELISRGVTNPEQLGRRFRRLGIGHMVVNRQRYDHHINEGLYSWSSAQRKIFEDFISNHCTPVAKFGAEIIYQLK
ncbi:MAG: hypothetical protein GY950_08905, partial [bacterium]|nr:hypothetical protein [bacterium]